MIDKTDAVHTAHVTAHALPSVWTGNPAQSPPFAGTHSGIVPSNTQRTLQVITHALLVEHGETL